MPHAGNASRWAFREGVNMEYHVVVSESSLELATVINQYLEKGWQLQGGVTACHAENDEYLNHVFAQAIIRPTPLAPDLRESGQN